VTDDAGRYQLRPAVAADSERLWRWANDPEVRARSFHPEPIPFESHARWYAAILRSAVARIWILEDAGQPVGQVRYERRNANETEVGISVAADHRGRGHATRLLVESAPLACRDLGSHILVAHILHDNDGSLRAFIKAGYHLVGNTKREGQLALRCERDCSRGARGQSVDSLKLGPSLN
jgi:RimJ/RimL family protein N-acetyltransferase